MTTNQPECTHAKAKNTMHKTIASAHHRLRAACAATHFFDGSGASAHHRESGGVAHGVPLTTAGTADKRPARTGRAGAADWSGDAVKNITKGSSRLRFRKAVARITRMIERMICLRVGQFRPNAAPGFLAQHLARQCAIAFTLDTPGLNRPHVTPAGQALVKIFFAGVEFLRPKTPLFCGNFIVHSVMLARRYPSCKRCATDGSQNLIQLCQ